MKPFAGSEEEPTLEAFGRTLALLAWFRGERAAVLARLGITERAFERASDAWNTRLVEASLAGDAATLKAFGAAFSAATANCRTRRPTLDDLEPPPDVLGVEETARMPAPDEVRRLIREAEPRFAFARAPRTPDRDDDPALSSGLDEPTADPSPFAALRPALPFVAPDDRS